MKNKIAIVTNFSGYDPTYSLIRIVETQLKSLLKHNYNVVLIAVEGFKGKGIFEKVETRYLPLLNLSNEDVTPTFSQDVEKLTGPLKEALADVKVAFTHDIFLQIASLPHNAACRMVAEVDQEIFWLNWIHSCPQLKPEFCNPPMDLRFKPIPNSFMVYPNAWDRMRVAKMYGLEVDDVKVVHHPIDIAEFYKFEDITRDFAERFDLYNADIIALYPLRMDRAKQPEHVLQIMAYLKEGGTDVRYIIADFQSTGERFIKFKKEIKQRAEQMKFQDNLIFTSEYKAEFKVGCPHEFITDLMKLANLFILPSRSETFSLVAQEAAMARNLLVLNRNFPPMRDIYGDGPAYFEFSSDVNAAAQDFGTTNANVSAEYLRVVANAIRYYLRNDRVIVANTLVRKRYNLEAVFKNEIEPLIAYASDVTVLKKTEPGSHNVSLGIGNPEAPKKPSKSKTEKEIKIGKKVIKPIMY